MTNRIMEIEVSPTGIPGEQFIVIKRALGSFGAYSMAVTSPSYVRLLTYVVDASRSEWEIIFPNSDDPTQWSFKRLVQPTLTCRDCTHHVRITSYEEGMFIGDGCTKYFFDHNEVMVGVDIDEVDACPHYSFKDGAAGRESCVSSEHNREEGNDD